MTQQLLPAASAGERWYQMDIPGLFAWLFSDRMGVVALLVIILLGFLIAAIALEKKTRSDFDRYDDEDEDSESGWSFFDDNNK